MTSAQPINAVYLTSTVVIFTLEGFLAGQTAEYYRNYPNDPRSTKIWVFLVNLVQLIHNSLCGYVSWKNLVVNFNPAAAKVQQAGFFPAALTALESLAGFLTNTWFAVRLYLFLGPRWKWIVIPTIATSTTVLGLGLVIAEQDNKAISQQFRAYVNSDQKNLHIPWVAGNILADILVAIPMVLKLHSTRSGFRKSGLPRSFRTDSILKSLTNYIIGTSLLTSMLAIAALILLLVDSQDEVWIALIRVMSSIYSNSLLTFLNRRRAWNDRNNDTVSGLHWSDAEVAAAHQVKTVQQTEVTIDRQNSDTYPLAPINSGYTEHGLDIVVSEKRRDLSPVSGTSTAVNSDEHVPKHKLVGGDSREKGPDSGLHASIPDGNFAAASPSTVPPQSGPARRIRRLPVPDEVIASINSPSDESPSAASGSAGAHGYSFPTDGFHAV